MNNETLLKELRQVQAANPGGLLKPADVVEFARNPETALHSQFEWDDTEAAAQYRLRQAGDVIRRAWVQVIDTEPIIHRAFVSLVTDRHGEGGGYRDLHGVMSNPAQTKSYLETALMEFRALQRKYQAVAALEPVFQAIRDVEAKAKPSRAIANGKAKTAKQPSV